MYLYIDENYVEQVKNFCLS